MSNLYIMKSVLALGNEIVGQSGPVKIDTGVYSHNIFLSEAEKYDDVKVLGKEGEKVTLEELINTFLDSDDLIASINNHRTYSFAGIRKISEKHFKFNWES